MSIHLKKLEKEEQIKLKARRKKIIKTRTEINDTENRKTVRKSTNQKAGYLKGSTKSTNLWLK